jgi:5-carboxymethyl-2-hydroxymuconate isomerase
MSNYILLTHANLQIGTGRARESRHMPQSLTCALDATASLICSHFELAVCSAIRSEERKKSIVRHVSGC